MMNLVSVKNYVNDNFSVKKNIVLANHSNVIVRTGVNLVVNNDEVQAEAKFFDSDLFNFKKEIDANPIFGKREYLKLGDSEKIKHEKFLSAISGLIYDWGGDDDEAEGSFAFDPGYYRELKKSSWAGSEEMSHIKAFEQSLKDRKDQYKALGYKLDIKDIDYPSDPKFTPPSDIPWKWIIIGGVVIVVGIVAVVAAPQVISMMAARKSIGLR